MKKILFAFVLLIGISGIAKADPLCTDWGTLDLCVPLSSLQAAYGYNFGASEGTSGNQALVETTFAKFKTLDFTFGGAKTSGEAASPYVSVTYGIRNPITESNNILAQIQPGVYGGRNFNNGEWIYGVKASVQIFQ